MAEKTKKVLRKGKSSLWG